MKVKRLLLLIVLPIMISACTATGGESPTAEPANGPSPSAVTATAEPTTPATPPSSEAVTPTSETTPTSTPSASGQAIPIRQIEMVDAQNGWAVGGRQTNQPAPILLTADGGQTWQERTPAGAQSLPGEMEAYPAMFFESTVVGWVSYPQVSPQSNPADLLIRSTNNGGQTWTNSEPLDFSGLPMEFFMPSDLEFIDGQFGWLMAHLGIGMSHDYIAVYTTNDGGQTWQRMSDPENNPGIQGCVKTGLVFINTAGRVARKSVFWRVKKVRPS